MRSRSLGNGAAPCACSAHAPPDTSSADRPSAARPRNKRLMGWKTPRRRDCGASALLSRPSRLPAIARGLSPQTAFSRSGTWLWRLERTLDRRHERRILRQRPAAPGCDVLAVASHQVLVEIPGGRFAGARQQVAIQRRGLVAEHVYRLEHRELHAIGQRAELGDLFLVLEFLVAEIA